MDGGKDGCFDIYIPLICNADGVAFLHYPLDFVKTLYAFFREKSQGIIIAEDNGGEGLVFHLSIDYGHRFFLSLGK
mgnify:FL=1